ncbi:MAG: endonuclease [Candidatus Magasanikbacteria bacterium CG_4_9_14_0_2_um_filter_41_10]|uniref:Endonuclease n=1 Tax=Candidatus Magasanikbacteria bacterium CG_4_10_14_0_2_um_filter_41_31 TaxID=1974639 RepID=A0A2M7V1Y3_9BACT|nr:MAG: endonuclease [Candidatus Magasanikbacteria bacterium CG_4_10_14_0_2_um_filter_41_31]PJC53194.1 MAG: endonuclease [Candidatus Magasanikbacteria bacterium CG_4_9_14_0_2_um_filter_41_10]
MHYVYFLWSDSLQKIYIGETPNVLTRLAYHNSGKQRYTKAGIPWRVIGYIPFPTKTEAKIEEKRLKKCKNRNYYRWYLQKNGKKNKKNNRRFSRLNRDHPGAQRASQKLRLQLF